MSTPSADRVVVVAGGTGLLGGAVVAALRGRGARVVVPSRRRAAVGDDDGVRSVQVGNWEDPRELVAVLGEPDWHPDAVVASIGGWWLGPQLVDLAPSVWREILESHLTGHFLVARALAPRLRGADPVYVLLNGAAATEPMAGSGPVSVTGAAQRMLLEVLRSEAIGSLVRFHEVNVRVAVAGDARNLDPEATVGADRVAAAVLAVLDDPRSAPVVPVAPPGVPAGPT
ncbi:MAG TPA: SDR family oxidoreductase [Actinotalea sp.]|nr:SDR family oxidoreductase [Actinotalea sp.]